MTFPGDWDIFHSANHWSTEETMIIVPFKRESFKQNKDYPARAIFDSFKDQTAPEIFYIHNVMAVQVPANCTDKLQPLNVSLNKPVKSLSGRNMYAILATPTSSRVNMHDSVFAPFLGLMK